MEIPTEKQQQNDDIILCRVLRFAKQGHSPQLAKVLRIGNTLGPSQCGTIRSHFRCNTKPKLASKVSDLCVTEMIREIER